MDADARPDPHWLCHLATAFMKSSHAGIGGPNIPPLDDGATAECVANAPGGPIHVLLSDEIAEHIPGCNMAFWKASLDAIGGFDPQFRIAGDDVDICWRLQDQGWTVGFSPGAVVWHHRRGSVRGYLKQQFEYGKAEALLERKWPERYNRMGHLAWAGRVYGAPLEKVLGGRWKIYYGTWGTGLFQSVYQRAPGIVGSLPHDAGVVPRDRAAGRPVAARHHVDAAAAGGAAADRGRRVARRSSPRSAARTPASRPPAGPAAASDACGSTTTFLYMAQPAARLTGRLRHGLSPWRRRSAPRLSLPIPRTTGIWSERWRAPDERVRSVESALRRSGGVIFSGGDFERWDLHVRGGMLGSMRMRMAVEEHGGGRQLLRIRSWPRFSRIGIGVALGFGALAAGAALSGAWIVAAVMAFVVAVIVACVVKDCATAAGVLTTVLEARGTRGAAGARTGGEGLRAAGRRERPRARRGARARRRAGDQRSPRAAGTERGVRSAAADVRAHGRAPRGRQVRIAGRQFHIIPKRFQLQADGPPARVRRWAPGTSGRSPPGSCRSCAATGSCS